MTTQPPLTHPATKIHDTKTCNCERCGHCWQKRSPSKQETRCPNCYSLRWNTPPSEDRICGTIGRRGEICPRLAKDGSQCTQHALMAIRRTQKVERVCRVCKLTDKEVIFTVPVGEGNICRPCASQQSNIFRYRDRNAFRSREHRYLTKKKFGITDIEYNALFINPRCQGCGAVRSRPRRLRRGVFRDAHLCVDHDHKTGQIRGLLCNDCNRALALAQDNPDILRNLVTYLEQDRRKVVNL